MTNSLSDLAAAAAAQSQRSRRTIPGYHQIVGGARVLRLFSFLCVCLGALLVVLSVVGAAMSWQEVNRQYDRALRHAQDLESSRPITPGLESQIERLTREQLEQRAVNEVLSLQSQRTLLICSVVGVVFSSVILAVAATVLRVFAWLALAVRDIAQNSFR